MINNALFCLLKKQKAKNIDDAQVKKLQNLIDTYKRRLPENTSDSEIAQQVLGKFKLEVDQEIRNAQQMATKINYLERIHGSSDRAEVEKVISDLTLNQHQHIAKEYAYRLGQPINEASNAVDIKVYNNLTPIEEEAMLTHVFGGKAPLNKDINKLSQAIIDTEERIRINYFNAGVAGHLQAPKNTLGVSFDVEKLLNSRFDLNEAVVDILENVDTKYLQYNSKVFDKVEGGLKEYIELGLTAVRTGTLTVKKTLDKYGIHTADFKQEFVRNLRIGNKEGWQKIHAKYGSGEGTTLLPYMLSASNTAAEDLARLTHFGSRPNDILNIISDSLEKTKLSENLKIRFLNKARENYDYLEGGLDNYSIMLTEFGKIPFTNTPIKPLAMITGLKQLGAMFLTGKATISALISDGILSKTALRDLGLKGSGRLKAGLRVSDQKDIMKFFQENREFAIHLGIATGKANDILQHQIRNIDTTFGSRKINQFSSWTLRKIGLTGITEINRAISATDLSFNLGQLRKSAFNELPTQTQLDLGKWGIDSSDWDIMRSKGLVERRGILYASPAALGESHIDQAMKFGRFFAEQNEKSVPTSAIALKKFQDKARASSPLVAAVAETSLSFQGWNGSFWQNHAKARFKSWDLYKNLMIRLTLSGAMVNIVDNALQNKWEDPTTAAFWLKGMATGGAASFFSDFVTTGARSLQGFTPRLQEVLGGSISGFALGTGLDALQIAYDNISRAANGKDTKVALDMFNLINQYNPGSRYYGTKFLMSQYFTKPIQRFLGGADEVKRQERVENNKKKQNITPIIGKK